MPDLATTINCLGLATVIAPLALVALLGMTLLLGHPLAETTTSALVQLATVVGLIAATIMLAIMILTGERNVPIDLGNWVEIEHFHFALKFVFDRLSVPFVILSFLLCGTIGAFASRYLHREPGFNRFFMLYALFLLGMVLTSLAGTIETLFAGWELVGISSALLVAFFHERTAPVKNGLRVWSVYRVSDAALLIAAVVLHHMHGEGNFSALLGELPWPEAHADPHLTSGMALTVGLLLVVAAAGKSGLVPFSGWLPRAMEGPTPSSAIFYGALSVHLGAYLLLRVSPLLEVSPVLCVVILLLGLLTAFFAASASRVQCDIKSALSFASLTQVGIIVGEIGLAGLLRAIAEYFAERPQFVIEQAGVLLEYVALVHLMGHACLRTLQFLRASSLLQDYRLLENAIGERLSSTAGDTGWLAKPSGSWLYRFAMERGYLDALLNDYLAQPALQLFRFCDSLERRWTDLLSGEVSRESDKLSPSAGSLEDLA